MTNLNAHDVHSLKPEIVSNMKHRLYVEEQSGTNDLNGSNFTFHCRLSSNSDLRKLNTLLSIPTKHS